MTAVDLRVMPDGSVEVEGSRFSEIEGQSGHSYRPNCLLDEPPLRDVWYRFGAGWMLQAGSRAKSDERWISGRRGYPIQGARCAESKTIANQ